MPTTDVNPIETRLLDGKELARRIRAEIATEIERLKLTPSLGVILVGDDPASKLYVSLKGKAGAEVGIRCHLIEIPADAKPEALLAAVHDLNHRPDIDGILVQFPLPPGFDPQAVIDVIDPAKDADGFRADSPVASPLIEAVLELVRASELEPQGHSAKVWANSPVFTERLMSRLTTLGFVPGEPADLAVVAVGKPRYLTMDKVKPGGVVIDVGTNREGDKVVGDADAASLMGRVSAMSPVPGGVGPLTVAMLMKNVLALAKRRANIKG
jgi:methylenetetrahydrofolate dehydrogenase (NADP+)/methenyltetrahydrofolate cyclohydrolase